MKAFNPNEASLTKYLFYTGKGGVGKTSTACATAISLADEGKNVLLISTDPASNLQDVFNIELSNKEIAIKGVPNLKVVNLDPIKAAQDYKESVIAPYRGKLPEAVLMNMEEQLSGSCTVEVAAFNEFSNYITNKKAQLEYDYIIFDTAPTGHTLRMLQLPSAWGNFIEENKQGASCLGQLAGLEEKKDIYKNAVEILSDRKLTTLILITRPDFVPIKEAERASKELKEIGIKNQKLIINGILEEFDDMISEKLYKKQQEALKSIPNKLKDIETFKIPLRSYNITGLQNIRDFLSKGNNNEISNEKIKSNKKIFNLKDIVKDLNESGKRVIFTMGKGGVGKTTVAAAIALGLVEEGKKVHLATTDPAAHLKYIVDEKTNITLSHIDEEKELENYKEEVLSAAAKNATKDDIAYLEEDLKSPCTQEIATFRAFANIVDKAKDEIVVVDTAPTGHTLLLLDSTQSYHKEVERSQGEIPESVKNLLPRLRNKDETEVLIVTLAETTPIFEAKRLEEDLSRAEIYNKWWVINSSFYATNTTNDLLKAKGSNEIKWINEIDDHSKGNFGMIPWNPDEIKGEKILDLIG